MPRPLRIAAAGVVFHILNRGNAGLDLLGNDAEYTAFELALTEAHARTPLRILAYCLMPSHWHLVLCPQADGALSSFVGWLTLTHSQRWHAARGTCLRVGSEASRCRTTTIG